MFEPQNIGTDLNVDGSVTSDNSIPVWVSGENYALNVQRMYESKLYVNILAINNSTNPPDSDTTHWNEVGTGSGGGGGGSNVPNAPAKQSQEVRYNLQTGMSAVPATSATITVDFGSSSNATSGFSFQDITNGNTISELITDSGSSSTVLIRLRFYGIGAVAGTNIGGGASNILRVGGGNLTTGTVAENLAEWVTQFNMIPAVGNAGLVIGDHTLVRNYTASSSANIVTFTKIVAGVTSGNTWTRVASSLWTPDATVSNVEGTAPTVDDPDAWVNKFLFTKIALFLGTEGTPVTNADPLLSYTPYTTEGVEYYFFQARDSGRGQWSNMTNPVASGAITWNLIG